MANFPVPSASGIATGITSLPTGTNRIVIASPTQDAAIPHSRVIVKGAVDTSATVKSVFMVVTTQTSTVGSYLAQVNGKYFAAEVMLAPGGNNTIIAKVTYEGGAQYETSVNVVGGNQPEVAKLTSSVRVGVPTPKLNGMALDVILDATITDQNPIVSFAWDFNGDGVVDLTCSRLSGVTASYTQVGLYLPTVTITDSQGHSYTATVIVNVLNAGEMNNFFKIKWNGMLNAFVTGDIPGAVSHYAEGSKDAFTEQLTALLPYRDQIVADMSLFSFVRMVSEDVAECELRTVKDGITYSFQVLYVRDDSGNWGIHSY